jgi:drug/metabolite transporter (DMT)-like permease
VGWVIGLSIALASAVASNVGFLLRHRGAVAAPDVNPRRPLRTLIDLFSSKWWTIGFGCAAIAWSLHVVALGFAPLSLVQVVLSSGLVLLGVLAERFFGFKLGRKQWAGIILTTLGLVLLTVTAAGGGGAHAKYTLAAAIGFEGALVIAGALLLMSGRVSRMSGAHGPLLGLGAGLLFTVSHVGIKALTDQLSLGDPATWLNVWVPVVLLAFIGAFFASARSLQIGPAVPVIAITSTAGNVSAILGGIVVFGDPVGSNTLEVALRVAAFGLVVIAAALIPGPTRVTEAGAESSSGAQAKPRRESGRRRGAALGAG